MWILVNKIKGRIVTREETKTLKKVKFIQLMCEGILQKSFRLCIFVREKTRIIANKIFQYN